MKIRLAALTIGLAIALNLSGTIVPANADPLPTDTSVEIVPVKSATEPEPNKSFFTLSRDALDFSKFAQRKSNKPRRDPYQIVTELRQRHREAAQDLSVAEKIQQLREQLPEQSSQLRSKVGELPNRIKTSANQATKSLRISVDTASRDYIQRTKLPPLIAKLRDSINDVKQNVKETTIRLLEQTSRRIQQTAQQLKN